MPRHWSSPSFAKALLEVATEADLEDFKKNFLQLPDELMRHQFFRASNVANWVVLERWAEYIVGTDISDRDTEDDFEASNEENRDSACGMKDSGRNEIIDVCDKVGKPVRMRERMVESDSGVQVIIELFDTDDEISENNLKLQQLYMKSKQSKTGRPSKAFTSDIQCISDSDDEGSGNISQPHSPLLAFYHNTISHFSTTGSSQTRSIRTAGPASPQKRGVQPGLLPSTTTLFTSPNTTHSNDITPDLTSDFNELEAQDESDWDYEHGLRAKRSRTASDHPMQFWLNNDREVFLEEIIRLEGRGFFNGNAACPICMLYPAKHRCKDCATDEMLCSTCFVERHALLPFHQIESWNESFFEKNSLKNLGLQIQLGHRPRERCLNPRRSYNNDFVVIDCFGIHEVNLSFCGCEKGISTTDAVQLLRSRLYPATGLNPRSAATFRVLKQFHILSFESKSTGYEFMKTLSRLTDNTGLKPSRVRYPEFLRMTRQWRHLKGLKRAGRSYSENGIAQTRPGEVALLCPACPHPGINLPPGWENAPEKDQWLYTLFVGIDGNFRLKRKAVSSEEKDPSLNDGWAFLVKDAPYKHYISENWNRKQERSTCVSHNAVNNAEKESRGLAVSGAITVDCIRHDFKRPNGVGDLQLGERYINSDYVLHASIRGIKIRRLVISYDIVCQWHKHFLQRRSGLPADITLPSTLESIIYLIPKFHLPAHLEDCNLEYSFNLTKGVGRTDGEAPERGWARMNPIAASTKEMGPGSRRDTLDDHFNDSNWTKTADLADSMLKKIKAAVPQKAEHTLQLAEFELSIGTKVVDSWRAAVEAWESDSRSPNPFKSETRRVSESAVRLQLAQDAARGDTEKEQYDAMPIVSDMHPSNMIALGLQLEDEQRRLHQEYEILGQHATTNQRRLAVEHSNRLHRKIVSWIATQQLYMPEAGVQRIKEEAKLQGEGVTIIPTELIKLWLPSSLPAVARSALRMYEWKLRHGQAYDALEEIRHNLRLRSHMYKEKDRYSRGVAQNTRSNNAIANVQRKIDQAATKYRTARAALVALSPGLDVPPWMKDLRRLEHTDIRGLSEGLFGDTEGRRNVSWIWLSSGVQAAKDSTNASADPEMIEALRIEWCRMRARAMRWAEEVDLLAEEMRRILAFFLWDAARWDERGKMCESQDEVTKEGLQTYAMRQASIRRGLHDRCAKAWLHVADYIKWREQRSFEGGSEEGGGPEIEGGEDSDDDVVDIL